jgi:electron transport complex protein RnfE
LSLVKQITKGIINENPVLRMLLGMCPTLAVTTSVINGVGMAAATAFVLVSSNVLVSSIKSLIPAKIRIPVYIIVIASFTTIVDLVMAATSPPLHKALGIFIPLIVVNCIIFGRAEAFASKNSVMDSAADGLGMGIGFLLTLVLVSGVREILGAGTIFGIPLFGSSYNPALVMILPPGAFLALGLLIGTMNFLQRERSKA